MNLVQLASDLEFVPKDQLAQMSQDPNTSYPPYLVLAEIQRRTANEKAYAAAQPRPTSTVAEEVVGEFMQPKGLQAGMPPESAPTDVFSSGEMGMPASAPMQQPMQQPMQMASGGLTGYAAGDRTSLQSTFEDPNANTTGSSSNPYPIDEEQKSFFADRYTKEDGSTDWGKAAFDGIDAVALAAILFPEPASTAAGAVAKGVSTVGRGLMNFVRNPRKTFNKISEKVGQRRIDAGKVPNTGPNAIPDLSVPFATKKIAEEVGKGIIKKRGLQTAGGIYVGSKFLPEGEKEVIDTESPEGATDDSNVTTLSDYAALLKKNAEDAKDKNNAYNLTQLGGLIMGSKSIGDLGMGLAGMAQQQQSRADTLKSEESKDAYYRASAEKLRAELENLPLEQKFDTLDNITETLKQAREGEIELTDERKLELNQASQLLTAQILKLQGIDSNSLAGLDVEKELGQQVIN